MVQQLNNLLSHLADSNKASRERTAESIYDAILATMAELKPVSGMEDSSMALIKLTRAAGKDVEFNDAILTVAQKALELFPNTVEAEPAE